MKRVFWVFLVTIVGFSSFLGLSSFQGKETAVERLMREAIQEKTSAYWEKERAKCKDQALKRANFVVDSILIERAKLTNLDTFIKPPKAPRPIKPIVLEPKDTSAIAPLVKEDSLIAPLDTNATKLN